MANVLIGCKLPHGIVLKDSDGKSHHINGVNTSRIHGGFGLTYIDASKWAELSAIYESHPAFKVNAIFTHNTGKVADVKAIAEELRDERTGFEALDPERPAANLKPEGNVEKMIEQNAQAPRPVKAPKSAADKAAAEELAGA